MQANDSSRLKDYEQISTLTKGLYILTRCKDSGICELEVSEVALTECINEAIQTVNNAIQVFNSQATPNLKGGRRLSILRRRSGDPMVFRHVEPAARLTRNQARLDDQILAVAYKLGGRNVPKVYAMRHLARENRRVIDVFNRICHAAGEKNIT